LAIGCTHETAPVQPVPPVAPQPVISKLSETLSSHLGKGPITVFGANVYSPGQEIYKALRQEDSLMAFLACQGEPDRVEVRENESPGAAPMIFLEYTRRSVSHGTVEIEPTRSGYYAASPIDPSGRLGSTPVKPPEKPKSDSKGDRSKQTEKERETRPPTPPEPEDEGTTPPTPSTLPPTPAAPQPTPKQSDECPIEPWRADCRSLCAGGATWEWCKYKD
jgi:hypothetical protein